MSRSRWFCTPVNASEITFSALTLQEVPLQLYKYDYYSAATLVHAFVSSRVDYCNAIFVGAPKNVRDKLQRVLNAAARIVSGTRKYDHGLTDFMHNELHWLDVPDRVKYKLGMLMYRCQHNQAPRYLMDHCSPVSDLSLIHIWRCRRRG